MDSNHRPSDYEPAELPTALQRLIIIYKHLIILYNINCLSIYINYKQKYQTIQKFESLILAQDER
jgi:hypothetical protein